LNSRTAIVTGAAQGIGETYAKALAAEGANVSLCDLQMPEKVMAEIKAAGGKAIGQACDVTDPSALASLVKKTVELFGGVQVLVNNAALFGPLGLKPFNQISSLEFDRVMTNIASGTVFKGTPMMAHYVASKGAVIALTRVLARELGDIGICCNCLAPGLTMSDAVRNDDRWNAPVAANVASRCLKREQTPDDLIGALIFLAAADSDFITGQTLVVDGGSAMH
jgi:NAD(P)-dependent dehydrogenase (short-subunit alcohol dehydrogenase family)